VRLGCSFFAKGASKWAITRSNRLNRVIASAPAGSPITSTNGTGKVSICHAGRPLLARGQDFEAQAFRYREAGYGFQFHPEVTFATLCRWALLTRKRMGEPGARPRHRHIEGWFRHDGAVARWSGGRQRALGSP
jgi:hypothetical protein